MEDLNFFEPYIGNKDMTTNKELVFIVIVLFLIIFHIIYSITVQFKIWKTSKDVAELKLRAEDKKTQKRVSEILNNKKELKTYEQEMSNLKILDEHIKENEIIDDILLELIVSCIPEDIFLKSINIDVNNLDIVGLSKDRWVIAEFQHSLSKMGKFKEVFISSISKEDNYYRFFLNIKLKEIGEDGDENSVEKENIEEKVKD